MRTRALLLALFVVACRRPPEPHTPHVAMGAEAAELRAAFNDALGKVRIVVLVSPS